MPTCVICQKAFEGHPLSKTCSPKCFIEHARKWKREWIAKHPESRHNYIARKTGKIPDYDSKESDDMNYGYLPTKKDNELLNALAKGLGLSVGRTYGAKPYLELNGLYEGVRIRRLTHLHDQDRAELIRKADSIYRDVFSEVKTEVKTMEMNGSRPCFICGKPIQQNEKHNRKLCGSAECYAAMQKIYNKRNWQKASKKRKETTSNGFRCPHCNKELHINLSASAVAYIPKEVAENPTYIRENQYLKAIDELPVGTKFTTQDILPKINVSIGRQSKMSNIASYIYAAVEKGIVTRTNEVMRDNKFGKQISYAVYQKVK